MFSAVSRVEPPITPSATVPDVPVALVLIVSVLPPPVPFASITAAPPTIAPATALPEVLMVTLPPRVMLEEPLQSTFPEVLMFPDRVLGPVKVKAPIRLVCPTAPSVTTPAPATVRFSKVAGPDALMVAPLRSNVTPELPLICAAVPAPLVSVMAPVLAREAVPEALRMAALVPLLLRLIASAMLLANPVVLVQSKLSVALAATLVAPAEVPKPSKVVDDNVPALMLVTPV